MYASLMFVALSAGSVFHSAYHRRAFRLWVQLRSIASSMVYRKAMRLSNAARQNSTVGHIVSVTYIHTSYTPSLTHKHHTHTFSHTQTQHTHTFSHTQTFSHTNTYPLSHTQTHILSHTQTHILSLFNICVLFLLFNAVLLCFCFRSEIT